MPQLDEEPKQPRSPILKGGCIPSILQQVVNGRCSVQSTIYTKATWRWSDGDRTRNKNHYERNSIFCLCNTETGMTALPRRKKMTLWHALARRMCASVYADFSLFGRVEGRSLMMRSGEMLYHRSMINHLVIASLRVAGTTA